MQVCRRMTAWLYPAEWKATLSPWAPEQRLCFSSGHSVLFVDLTSPPATLFSNVGISHRSNVALSVAISSLNAGAAICSERWRSNPDSAGSSTVYVSSARMNVMNLNQWYKSEEQVCLSLRPRQHVTVKCESPLSTHLRKPVIISYIPRLLLAV